MNKMCPISSWISFFPSPDLSTLASGAHRNMIFTQLPIVEQTSNVQFACNAILQSLPAWLVRLGEILFELSIERSAFSFEIPRSDGTTSRISRQGHSCR